MKKKTSMIRRILWLGTSIVFLVLIIDSYRGMKTVYPTFAYRIPSEYNMQIGDVRFQDVINQFADNFDAHVTELGREMRHNSTYSFWTNIASFLLALIGFLLELREGKRDESE
jgi:hypothetical protein